MIMLVKRKGGDGVEGISSLEQPPRTNAAQAERTQRRNGKSNRIIETSMAGD
jgi:hypothetical protein